MMEQNSGEITKEVFQQSRQPPALIHDTESLRCQMEIPVFLKNFSINVQIRWRNLTVGGSLIFRGYRYRTEMSHA
jgi:hypothetical protein